MSEQPDIDKLDSNFKQVCHQAAQLSSSRWITDTSNTLVEQSTEFLFNKGIFHNIYLQYLPSRIQVLYNIRILENLIKSICPECKGMIQTKLTYVSGFVVSYPSV
ncbi:unnamed protein product [Paramecium octaurelia]|uniref:Uncharacterized protein n=1 Tax=Paramecium octaurelia TaxID=43137 RepID=A0A8S1TAZ4_PAROT|nr:unnamed protein product [Paramecium octaurelia]